MVKDESSATETYTRFTAEPFEAGYGHTVGNANITTVGQIAQKTKGEMLKYRNFGKKSLNEIKDKLQLALQNERDTRFQLRWASSGRRGEGGRSQRGRGRYGCLRCAAVARFHTQPKKFQRIDDRKDRKGYGRKAAMVNGENGGPMRGGWDCVSSAMLAHGDVAR